MDLIKATVALVFWIVVVFGPAFAGGVLWHWHPVVGAAVAALAPVMFALTAVIAKKQNEDWTRSDRYRGPYR
jgi:protein-S-isoprenylcysteine O-methyltransferase Ste14